MNKLSAIQLSIGVSLFVMVMAFEAPLVLKVTAILIGGTNLSMGLMSLGDKT